MPRSELIGTPAQALLLCCKPGGNTSRSKNNVTHDRCWVAKRTANTCTILYLHQISNLILWQQWPHHCWKLLGVRNHACTSAWHQFRVLVFFLQRVAVKQEVSFVIDERLRAKKTTQKESRMFFGPWSHAWRAMKRSSLLKMFYDGYRFLQTSVHILQGKNRNIFKS